jgi:hypothetical protein
MRASADRMCACICAGWTSSPVMEGGPIRGSRLFSATLRRRPGPASTPSSSVLRNFASRARACSTSGLAWLVAGAIEMGSGSDPANRPRTLGSSPISICRTGEVRAWNDWLPRETQYRTTQPGSADRASTGTAPSTSSPETLVQVHRLSSSHEGHISQPQSQQYQSPDQLPQQIPLSLPAAAPAGMTRPEFQSRCRSARTPKTVPEPSRIAPTSTTAGRADGFQGMRQRVAMSACAVRSPSVMSLACCATRPAR